MQKLPNKFQQPLKDQSTTPQSRILKLEDNFKKICLLYQLPLSYCTAFIKYLNSSPYENKEDQYKVKMFIISDETNFIKKGESFPQSMAQILTERQKVLKHLRSDLITTRNPKQLHLSDCIDKLQSIRMYNLNILQHLSTLAKRFKSSESPYFWNIVDKINRDLDFLRFSFLRRHIEFSSNHDPLLISPLRKFQNLQATADHNRKSILQFLTIDSEYRKRLDIADNFLKKITSTLQKVQLTSQDPLETQTDRYNHKQSRSKGKSTEYHNETMKKSNLPDIHKKSPPLSYHGHPEVNQKKIVANIIKQIIEQYNFKERNNSLKQDKSNLQANKKRSITQANERPSIYNTIHNQMLNTHSKIRESAAKESSQTDQKNNKSQKIQRGMKVFHRKMFRQDEADISKDQQSMKSSKYINKLSHNKYPKSLPKHQPFATEIKKHQVSERANIKFRHHLSGYEDDLKYKPRVQIEKKPQISQKQSKIQHQKQEEGSIVKGQPKLKANRIRPNKIVNRGSLKPKTEEMKQTIYKEQQQLETKMKSERQTANHQLQQEQDKLNTSDTLQSNQKLLNKIKDLKNMSNSAPIQKQLYFSHLYSKNTPQKCNQNEVFQSPLDKVLQLRENIDNESDHEDKFYRKKSQKQLSKSFLSRNLEEEDFGKNSKELINNQLIYQSSEGKYESGIFHYNNSNYLSRTNQTPKSINQQIGSTFQIQRKIQHRNNGSISHHRISKTKQFQNNNYKSLSMHNQYTQGLSNINNDRQFHQTFGTTFDKRHDSHTIIQYDQDLLHRKSPFSQTKKESRTELKSIIPSPLLKDQTPPQIRRQVIPDTPQFPLNQPNHNHIISINPTIPNISKVISNNTVAQSENNNSLINSKLHEKSASNLDVVNEIAKNSESYITKKDTNLRHIEIKLPTTDDRNKSNTSNINTNTISTPKVSKDSPQLQTEQQLIQKQSTLVLQKCSFVSKSIKQQQLLAQMQQSNPSNYDLLKRFICTQYFMQRQIQLTSCLSEKQLAFYCLYYPHITENQREIIILHIQFIKPEFKTFFQRIFTTLLKYFFVNDPTQKIILLKHKILFDATFANTFKSIKHYSGQETCSIKASMIEQNCYLFARKDVVYSKKEQYTTILDTSAIFVASQPQIPVSDLIFKNTNISSDFLKRINAKIKGKCQKFSSQNELQNYLQQQHLPLIKCNHSSNILLTYSIWQDCLLNPRFYIHSKTFFFTIQPPHTYFYQNLDAYYFLISTSDPKKYFLLADKLYEQDQDFNILNNFQSKILNKNIKDIFFNSKHNNGNKIIGCPMFKKQVNIQIDSKSNALINFDLKWKQYIKGVRYYKEEDNFLCLMSPFLCVLLNTDQNGTIKYQYSTLIEENDILK